MHPLLTHWRGLAVYLLAWALAGPALALLLHALGIAPAGAAMPWTVPLCAVFAFMLLATALVHGQASVLVPVAQMGFVITAAAGIFLLGEASSARKICGLLAAVGALLCLAMS